MNNKFKGLAEALKGQVAEDKTTLLAESKQIDTQKRASSRKALGKRSNPNYELVGVYVPKAG